MWNNFFRAIFERSDSLVLFGFRIEAMLKLISGYEKNHEADPEIGLHVWVRLFLKTISKVKDCHKWLTLLKYILDCKNRPSKMFFWC